MKEAILKKVDTLTEAFKLSLNDIEKAEQVKVSELEKQILQSQEIGKDFKDQTEANKKKLDAEVQRLTEERQKVITLQKQLDTEIAKYQDLQKNLEKDNRDAIKNLEDAKIERGLASETLQRAKEKEKEYQQKLKNLADDTLKLDADSKALKERERLLAVKEKLALKREEEQAEKEKDYLERVEAVEKREKSAKTKEKNLKTLEK